MEDELRIYESNVKAFEDYCAERKLSCMLQVEAYPLSVTVYQSGDSRQIRGQLSMEDKLFAIQQMTGLLTKKP